MRYVRAKEEILSEERSFREYLTESLRLKGENKYITTSWRDLISGKKDNRTGDEIAADFISRSGLTLKAVVGDNA